MTMPYTRIPNSIIQDKTLSYGATGLFCYMLSMPTGWKFHIQDLAKRKTDKRYSTRQFLKELESLGLVEKQRITDQQGKIRECNFQLKPQSNFHTMDTKPESNYPNVDKTTIGKSDTINNTEEETIHKNKKSRGTPTHKSFKSYSLEEFEKEVRNSAKEKGMAETAATKFINWWAEKDDKGRMKFQLGKTWETGRRIATWMSKDYNNPQSAATPAPEVNPMVLNAKTQEELMEIFK